MRIPRLILALALVALTSGLYLSQSWAATTDTVVTNCTEAGLDAALSAGGVITFNCGTATITLSSEKNIAGNITLDGGDQITLSGGDTTRLFHVQSSGKLTLKQITLSNGFVVGNGGAILNQGEVIINDSILRNHHAEGVNAQGGAIQNEQNALLTMKSSQLLDNIAFHAAAGIDNSEGTVVLDDVLVQGNIAETFAGIDNGGTMTIRNSIVRDNTATLGYGGGIGHVNGTLVILNSTITNNSADNGHGGGIAAFAGSVTIERSEITDNTGAVGGGALFTNASDSLAVTLRDSRLTGNKTTAQNPPNSDPNIVGGAIENSNELTLERVTLDNNESGGGGALFSNSSFPLTLRDSTISNNRSTGVGGGIWLNGGTDQTLTNVTISGNTADAYGGGLLNDAAPLLRNVTFFGNNAADGANLYNRLGLTMVNTILAAPVTGPNCVGVQLGGPPTAITSDGHNIASDDSCVLEGEGDLQDTDALLGALADNGGSTQTHLPQANSPAIDNGVGCPENDQRGFARTVGDSCDIGATEAGAAAPAPTNMPTATSLPSPTPTATATTTPTLPAPDAPLVPLEPADLPDGVPVTLQVNPLQAPAGSQITISGQGAPGSSQVRLTAVIDRQTIGIQDADVDGNGAYSVQVTVGANYEPGVVQLCALALGLPNAEVVCTDLTIQAPGNGSVEAVFPLLEGRIASGDIITPTIDADFVLLNAAGETLYASPFLQNGTVAIRNVAPGQYNYGVVGVAPYYAAMGTVAVKPLKPSVIPVAIRVDCSRTQQLKPTTVVSANPSRKSFVRTYQQGTLLPDFVDEIRPFGLYIQGVPNTVTFTASPQASAPVQKVIFEFVGLSSQTIARSEDTTAPYTVQYNVGSLPISQVGKHPTLVVTPVVNGVEQCASVYQIEVINNPMVGDFLQPIPYSNMWWDGEAQTYRYQASIPYIKDVLPAYQNVGTIPYLGHLYNKLNTGLNVSGVLNLEGKARVYIVQAFADAVILGLPVISPDDGRVDVTPPGFANVEYDIRDARKMVVPFRTTLVDRPVITIPAVKILVFTYFGIINAYVNGQIVFGVGVYLDGQVQPLVPAADVTLTGSGSAAAEIGLSVDIILGIVEGGLGLGGAVCVYVPLHVGVAPNTDFDVSFVSPSVGGRFYIVAWGSAFWGLYKTRTTKTIANIGPGCGGNAQIASLEQEEDELIPPEFFVSPVVAAAPNGRILSAYVENTAPPGETEQVQIMARFQEPGSEVWSAPQAISNPAHSSQAPTVAFVGPDQTPMVAWAENTLIAEEAAALGEDANAHMSHLEIYYALWENGSWSEPLALTEDLLAEGLPELAGTPTSAVLAWTRDLDGDVSTRDDQRIAVSLFDLQTNRFGPPDLLSGEAGGLNNDVSVAFDTNGDTPIPYLAWVNDADADLLTADDRQIALAYNDGTDWVLLNPQPLPPRVDSPAITVGPDGVEIAFLVREATPEDGEVGTVGVNGVLWRARVVNNEWTANPVLDEVGELIYAEQPELDHVNDETLLLFRRFDNATEVTNLGQLSLSQIVGDEEPSPPLYLTNELEQKWLPSLAINPITQRAIILNSTLVFANAGAANAATVNTPAATQAMAETNVVQLGSATNVVEAFGVNAGADPALDPLQTSSQAPAPGSQVIVVADVRNVGRGTASNLSVRLYRGPSASGTPLGTVVLTGTLGFNEKRAAIFNITAEAGEFPLFAQLSTSGENVATGNDSATKVLGLLSAPSGAAASASDEFAKGLTLVWSGNGGEYVSGYRILRSSTVDGPWEVVGESAIPTFTDTLVQRGQSYCYAIQAYNVDILSTQGPATCSQLPVLPLFLPTVRR